MSTLDLSIRFLVETDVPAADQILKSAFRSEESREADLRRYLALEPRGWRLALRENQPVGMVGAIEYGPFAYLGLMAVHDRAQRQGIGRRLLETLLADLDQRGCPMVLLDATEMGAPLYRQLGFVEEGQSARYLWSGWRQSGRAAPAAVYPLRPADLPTLADFDAPIFGARREKVLAAYLAENPGRAWLARDPSGRIQGYLFAQADRLGPWMAASQQAAGDLLQAALALPFQTGPRVILPERNRLARDLLPQFGFELLDLHLHMRRGGSAQPGLPEQVFGMASFAIG